MKVPEMSKELYYNLAQLEFKKKKSRSIIVIIWFW